MRRVVLLGATGSIGRSTLDVIAQHPERYEVVALAAGRDHGALFDLISRIRPPYAALADEDAASRLRERVAEAGLGTRIGSGEAGLLEAACYPDADTVVAGIVGAAGLAPTLAAAEAGRRILLANKESLVMAGPLLTDAVARHDAQLLPVDSEHNAIFQCLPPEHLRDLERAGVDRILLTGSGGPFRGWSDRQLATVTPEQACQHPNWAMGRKISVDSATLMNKGLELIEACWLFQTPPERIEIVIHPQSIVHSMVRFRDGSVLAQLGQPDMRTPIAHALAWPERVATDVEPLDPVKVGPLEFEHPDEARFPCLRLARNAMETGGTAPAVLNAANEVAVEAFLEGRLRFPAIAGVVADTLDAMPVEAVTDLETLRATEGRARMEAVRHVARHG